jgi:class 3 adenylate cyclase
LQLKVNAAVTYVPQIIRRRFERNPAPLTTPVESVFQGAILFIDVSGFTMLNERLGKLGPGGPEQVSKHLNTYFGQVAHSSLSYFFVILNRV